MAPPDRDERRIDTFDEAPDYARNYLRTFFMGEPTADDRIVMGFIASERSKLAPGSPFLEVGCGPTVNHVVSLAPVVSEIHMADLRQDNLDEVDRWRRGDAEAHDWSRFVSYALHVEGVDASAGSVEARTAATRERIREVRVCDLRQRHPLGTPAQYPGVGCFYATEQASRTRDEWPRVFSNLAGLVAPGGQLLACAVGNTDHYVLYDGSGGSHRYPVPRLDVSDFANALAGCGFDLEGAELAQVPISGQESEGVYEVILVSARKLP